MSLPKIDVPLYSVKVPSTSKKINIRPLTVKEEKILLIAQAAEDPKQMLLAIKQVVNNCIQESNFDIGSLTLFDLEYLLIQLRARSINNIVSVSYRDSEDGITYSFDIDLDKLSLDVPKKPNFKIKLSDNKILMLMYPTLESMNLIVSNYDKQESEMVTLAVLDKLYDGDEVYNFSDYSVEDVEEFLDSLDLATSEKIKLFIEQLPTVTHVINYVNAKGNKREIVLKGVSDFFI